MLWRSVKSLHQSARETAVARNGWRSRLDRIGTWISLSCAVHCLALPALLTITPLLGLSLFVDAAFEKVFSFAAIGIGIVAALWGFLSHRRLRVLLMLVAAFILFVIAKTQAQHGWEEGIIMGLGGTLLATTHLLNSRFCRHCPAHCGTAH